RTGCSTSGGGILASLTNEQRALQPTPRCDHLPQGCQRTFRLSTYVAWIRGWAFHGGDTAPELKFDVTTTSGYLRMRNHPKQGFSRGSLADKKASEAPHLTARFSLGGLAGFDYHICAPPSSTVVAKFFL